MKYTILLVFLFTLTTANNRFEDDLILLNSDDWTDLGQGISTKYIDGYSYPFYKYSVITEHDLNFIYDIEGPKYWFYSKNWIPQLINGKSDNNWQYITYNFFPLPDQAVCQNFESRWYNETTMQISFRTGKHNICSDTKLTLMDEVVAKFITVNYLPGKIKMTYIGMEDPNNWMIPPWLAKMLYPKYYKDHLRRYKNFLANTPIMTTVSTSD